MKRAKQKSSMGKKSVGARITAGLQEFCDAVENDKPLTMRTVELDLQPSDYNSEAVRSTRQLLKMSQPLFAQFLGVDVKTVQAWEQGLREPKPIARRFMDEIQRDPEHWLRRLNDSMVDVANAS